eukprot:3998013-Lingulodinium_polyedra.AAC.1
MGHVRNTTRKPRAARETECDVWRTSYAVQHTTHDIHRTARGVQQTTCGALRTAYARHTARDV